jgi:DNA-binding response OmpR family regulator
LKTFVRLYHSARTLEELPDGADKTTVTTPASPVVLLVEDDHGVRRPLEKFLQMHHFKVVTAETADDAIDAIQLHRPAAAIVDLRLARGSGRDVVISMPAGTPVIIFSGVPTESAELERLRPRTRLVQKPYSLTMLVESLRDMLTAAKRPEN